MKPLIIANWKCNPTTLQEAQRILNSVKRGTKKIKNVEIVICPPFIYLPGFKFQFPGFKLGAQDCFWEEKGAFTGEVSALMLKNLGCKYVIIGHSERRALGETDKMINKKIKATLKVGLKPIICIGETEKERKNGTTNEVLKKQLKKSLNHLATEDFHHLIVTYEPVWAIGTGKACGIPEALKANLFIRKIVKNAPILYGGSVNSKNALDFIKEAKFEGFIIGGASLKPEEFIKIMRILDNY